MGTRSSPRTATLENAAAVLACGSLVALVAVVEPAGLDASSRGVALALAAGGLAGVAALALAAHGDRRALRQASRRAEHDGLTGLPGRAVFERRVAHAVDAAARSGGDAAIAVVSIDGFRAINDALGPRVGDALLTTLADRLVGSVRPDDTVARLDGDAFGVVLRACGDPSVTLWRLRETIERAVDVDGLSLTVDAAIGWAPVAEDPAGVDELVRRAEVAMRAAKAHRAGVARYASSDDPHDASGVALASDLGRAIDAGELVLHYLPIARAGDGRVEALEALVRWQHPTGGLLAPDRFVPLVQHSALDDRLTEWVVRHALDDACDLQVATGMVAVTVNVSVRRVCRPGLAALLTRELRRTGLPAELLCVEVPEGALACDLVGATRTLAELHAIGVRLSVDDVGSGPLPLDALGGLPIDELKVDRGVVARMAQDPAAAAVVRAVAELGHGLGLDVVAEGVASPEAWAAAAAAGCDAVQGYQLARPMPRASLGAWLVDHRAPRDAPARARTGAGQLSGR